MDEHGRRFERWRGWWPLLIAAGVYVAAIATVAAIRAESSSDFRDYWRTAAHFRETGEISAELGVHNYLPFFTLFMLPLSFLPLRVAMVVFVVLSFALLALTVVLVEQLLHTRVPGRPRRATLAALGLILAYVHSATVLGTVNLLLLFLVIATWVLVEQQRDWAAGVALGLATLIKLVPGALIVFFLLQRRWRVAAMAAVVGVIGGLGLPLLAVGPAETVAQHERFARTALGEHGARSTLLADKPIKAKYSNNALPMVLRRLLTPTDGDPHEERPALLVNVAALPRRVVYGVYVVVMAVVLGLSALAALQRPREWPPEDRAGVDAVRAQFGVWCCVMLLAAPLVWTHYLVLAYWPLAYLADRAERTERARGAVHWWCVAGMVAWLAGAVCLASPAARAAGAQLWSVAAVWVVLVVLALRPRGRVVGG